MAEEGLGEEQDESCEGIVSSLDMEKLGTHTLSELSVHLPSEDVEEI